MKGWQGENCPPPIGYRDVYRKCSALRGYTSRFDAGFQFRVALFAETRRTLIAVVQHPRRAFSTGTRTETGRKAKVAFSRDSSVRVEEEYRGSPIQPRVSLAFADQF